jgi:lipopolysaccharide transport system ATP-binding protein
MYLRLAFSVAAHLDADILFVDELLAVGDAEFQKRCLGRITELTHSGRTVVFVSHNMAAIRSLCDRCCLLDGRVTRYGDVDDCIAHYLQSTSEAIQPIVWLPRPRNASPRMLSVALISGGAFASKIFMGDEVTIRVTFESDTPLQNPRIGYSIRGETGESLLSGNNRYQQSAGYALPVTSGSIRCELGRVPLMRGRYWVSLYLGDAPLHDSHSVEDALQFEVIERDLWGMGATPDPRVSQLWWPTRFEFD